MEVELQGKFKNIKTEYNGEVYDSRKEARRAFALDLLLKAGKIRDLERQKAFVLQEGYYNNKKDKIRPIFYIADFVYYDNERKMWTVEDVKSPATRTEVYRIKKKLFEYKYPEYWFIET